MSPEQRGPEERPANAPDPKPAEIRAEIDRTRERLGDTVEALAEKTDVKAKARAKAEETKAQIQRNPAPAAAFAVVLLLFVLWRIRRHRS